MATKPYKKARRSDSQQSGEYAPPILKEFGPVAALTQNGTNPKMENATFVSRSPKG